MSDPASLRALFLLDAEVVFLNHGSFGACPRPVFEVYQEWQRDLERQPVAFLGRRHDSLLGAARGPLSAFLNVDPADLAFVTNASAGINAVARSVRLEPGDEVLTTDHEYGAMDSAWAHACAGAGARLVRRALPLPIPADFDLAAWLWAGVTPRTRVLFASHVTSPTALVLPIASVLRRARESGILTVIDGAHGPGHIPVDLSALDPDFYAGNCHKWLCAPKGAGFLYARRDRQDRMEPPVLSWGWHDGSPYARRLEQQGTRDLAAFLSVPAAIAFQAAHDWDAVRARCHRLAADTAARLTALTGLSPVAPEDWHGQMVAVPLPSCDARALKDRLYDDHHIEVPVTEAAGRSFLRVSFQGYNSAADGDRLVAALAAELPGAVT